MPPQSEHIHRPSEHGRCNPALGPLALLLLALAPPSAQAAGSFGGLGLPWGAMASRAAGISADGSVVVGSTFDDSFNLRAFLWSNGSMSELPGWSGATRNTANAVSADGTTTVGATHSDGVERAMVWRSGGAYLIDALSSNIYANRAYGVSGDGMVVVGSSDVAGGGKRAFSYDRTSTTLRDLGVLGGTGGSEAYGISADAGTIVGSSSTSDNVNHAFRYVVAANTMHDLGTLGSDPAVTNSHARAVSANGSVIVGYSQTDGGDDHAFRWSGSVMSDLGVLAGGTYSRANAVSGNGLVVVGEAEDSNGDRQAFRWTQGGGMKSVAQWLAAANVALAAGWTLTKATGTSSDGSVVVGSGDNPAGREEAWIARIGGAGNGLMSVSDYVPTLQKTGTMPRTGVDLATLALFGAHHRPLMDSGLPQGSCAWATADLARNDANRSTQEIAEVGACRDLAEGRWRIGASVGTSSARQDLDYAGQGRFNGQYLYVEADYAPESRAWVASASALYGNWNGSVRRGYLNAGRTDGSSGAPNANALALRARMDWKDLLRLGTFGVSPYASYTRIESRLDAYTETGGGFPARFDAQTWRADEFRIGAMAKMPLSYATDLRLNLEAVNRQDRSGPGVSGQVLGLFSFAYAGASMNSSWGRLMAEIDHRLSDKSLFTFNVNTASSGQDATWGVSAGYRLAF